jgi:hypothetical protein
MLDTAHRPRISEAVLRRVEKWAERRPFDASPRESDGAQLSRRLRSMPPANLRRRIYPS